MRILAHGDTDGVCAAAIAKSQFPDADVWFTRPVRLLRYLQEIEPGTTVMIFDIAINETEKDEIFARMRELARADEVIYVDHHPLPADTLKKDIPATQLAHEVGISSSELTFRLLIQDPRSDLDRVALWGAIADYCEQTDFVQEKLNKYDRRTIYMEAGLLSQALGEARGDYDYKRQVVEALARGIPPSDIPELPERALRATKREWGVYEYVKNHVVLEGNIAVVYNLPHGSLGKAALYAMGITGAAVGMCTRQENDEVDISMRKRANAKVDLNILLRRITARLGGSGGGHEGAAGATIPAHMLDTFLEIVKREVAPISRLSPTA